MKTFNLILPDKVVQTAADEATERGVDVSTLCSGILSDYFLGEAVSSVSASSADRGLTPSSPRTFLTGKAVMSSFSGFPFESKQMAQRFVEEALKIPGVTAYVDKRGVGFEPNFVWIEYLMSLRTGIAISLFGSPTQHARIHKVQRGRGASYSRLKIYSQKELGLALPLIRHAYDLKFSKR